jgi:hypothetical protein
MQPDTRRLLFTGLAIFGTGAISVLLMFTVFGGVTSNRGPHTNLGWLSLMLAMGCVPTGLLTLLLAAVKLIGEHRR